MAFPLARPDLAVQQGANAAGWTVKLEPHQHRTFFLRMKLPIVGWTTIGA